MPKKWTKKTILNESKKYNSIKDWYSADGNSYGAACRTGVIEEASAACSDGAETTTKYRSIIGLKIANITNIFNEKK